jgi:tRNA A37 methylthiotransferase MiaB
MNRYYKIEEVYTIVKEFRKEIPLISFATDLIVGYPTETEDDFKETLKAIEEIKPDFVNISRYGTRKNIEANKYKDLSGTIKKERSRIVTEVFEKIALENNKKFVGFEKEIIINEIGKNNTAVGKTEEYKSVVIKKPLKIGFKAKVKLIKAEKYYLLGEIANPK